MASMAHMTMSLRVTVDTAPLVAPWKLAILRFWFWALRVRGDVTITVVPSE